MCGSGIVVWVGVGCGSVFLVWLVVLVWLCVLV